MMHSHGDSAHNGHEHGGGESWLFSRTGVATCVALAVLGFLIYEGHGAHLLGLLPWLLILSCPLMHIFMHGGHHHHHDEERGDEEKSAPQPERQTDNNKQPQHQHMGGCH